jgi:rSAM/selenodomain-associated transferase 1
MVRPLAILVMAKTPRRGRVKTRLAPLLGQEGCAHLQSVLLQQTVEIALAVAPQATYIAVDPPDAEGEVAVLVPPAVCLLAQEGAHLGERLAAATEAVLSRGHDRLVVVGTDAPLLREEQLRQTIALLGDDHDVVFGPAFDGGYYLVSLSRALSEVFDIDPALWGGPDVLAASLCRAEELGLRVGLLAPMSDLDTPADAAALLSEPDLPEAVRKILAIAVCDSAGALVT